MSGRSHRTRKAHLQHDRSIATTRFSDATQELVLYPRRRYWNRREIRRRYREN